MPAPPPRAAAEPKQERGHATRQRLLAAAVEELLECGYTGLTTHGVARRAGVSRGAHQNYFPHKTTLLVAAVRHLAARQIDELQDRVAAVPSGHARVEAGLDMLFEQYSGPLFAAMVELSLAGRNDATLLAAVAPAERSISKSMQATASAIFDEQVVSTDAFAERWPTVLSAIRGLALLKLLGHPRATVNRQWKTTRRQMIELMT